MMRSNIRQPGAPRSGRQRGFSMVELLVAVLIMGVGVLGVTGLQMVSLQNNRDSLMRGEAVQLAYDILDRVRVNQTAGAAAYTTAFDDDPAAAPADCYSTACTPAQMAAFDLSVWKCSLGDDIDASVCDDLRDDGVLPDATDQPGLPDGQGRVTVAAGGLVTVTVQWTGFGGAAQQIAIESQG